MIIKTRIRRQGKGSTVYVVIPKVIVESLGLNKGVQEIYLDLDSIKPILTPEGKKAIALEAFCGFGSRDRSWVEAGFV